jgi:hypothetical protein
MACLGGSKASADSIVTSNLSFTCDNGCIRNFGGAPINTSPDSGSFTYDKSTKQFLSFNIVWDGFTCLLGGLQA